MYEEHGNRGCDGIPEPDTLEYFGAISQLDKGDINSWLKLLN
jgi:hypothetical protein